MTCILAVALLQNCATSSFHDTEAFDEMVFGAAIDDEESDREPLASLARWDVPVRVRFAVMPDGRFIRLTETILNELQTITEHDLRLAQPGETANLVVIPGDPRLLERELTRMGARVAGYEASSAAYGFCWSTHWVAQNRIIRGLLYIASEESFSGEAEGALESCYRHELGHVMGLRFHAEHSYSVMGPLRTVRHYTQADRAVLNALYAPQISPGMARDDVLKFLSERQ